MTAAAITTSALHPIDVSVEPVYLAHESDATNNRYVWAYTVSVTNRSAETVQLVARYWHIVDGMGRVQEVNGPGVIGKQPHLVPGETFRYTSACPLTTPQGLMSGHYVMETRAGLSFQVPIPAFSLDSPHTRRVLN